MPRIASRLSGRGHRPWPAIALMLLLGACAEHHWADDAAVNAVRYREPGPAEVTLFTAVRTRGGEGAHSGLMVNANERLLFDPAGNFAHPAVPERGDVLYGITPRVEEMYIDFHARPTYYIKAQTVEVSPEVAQMIADRAVAHGASWKALCSTSVSQVLDGVPGFEGVDSVFPGRLADDFARLPGVVTTYYYDDDESGNPLRVQFVPDAQPVMKRRP